MKKDEIVACLIANEKNKFTAEDSEFLTGLSEEQLHKMAPECACSAEERAKLAANEKAAEEKAAEEKAAEEKAKLEANEKGELTYAEQLSAAGITDPALRAFLQRSVDGDSAKKEILVKALIANAECKFPDKAIEQMDLQTLEYLAQSLAAEDFAGLGGPQINSNKDTDIEGPPPVVLAEVKTEQ